MVIKTKIITIIALTIIIAVGVTTAVVLTIQNRKMEEAKIEDTIFLGDIIERTIGNAMREGRTGEVQTTIEEIGKNKEVVNLRILSPSGMILKSTNAMEIGVKSPDYLKLPNNGINQRPAIIDNTTINYFRNVMNTEECYGCHSSNEVINGVIQIKLDISRNYSSMTSIRRIFVFSHIIVVLVVSLILSLLFSRYVMDPLKKLLAAIHEVEAGNWNATVKDIAQDELGIIGKAFNTMINEMNKLYRKNIAKERELSKIRIDLGHKSKVEALNAQLEFKIKELETANRTVTTLSREVKGKNIELEKAVARLRKLNDIGRVLTSIIETEEIMKIITRTTADLFAVDKAFLYIKNTEKPPVIIHYRHGLGTETLAGIPPEYENLHAELVLRGRPLLHHSEALPSSLIGVPLRMKSQVVGSMVLDSRSEGVRFSDDDLELLSTLANQTIVSIENAWLYESVKHNYFSTIQSLVNALEANDMYTKGHSERVKILSLELGRHIGLDLRELEVLEHASILHDIGKIGIESFILQKQGKLTAKEYGMIKSHPLIGEEILGPIETLSGVRQTIIQHHERYDGKGYPYGLRGEELSLKARILSVVDTFDAMMSERPYRKAHTLYEIKEELGANAGTQFDPYIVESFIEMLNQKGDLLLSSAGYIELHSVV